MQPPKNDSQSPIEPLQGVVERITYHSEESGYTIARLKAPRISELVTIVGNFAKFKQGKRCKWREPGERIPNMASSVKSPNTERLNPLH